MNGNPRGNNYNNNGRNLNSTSINNQSNSNNWQSNGNRQMVNSHSTYDQFTSSFQPPQSMSGNGSNRGGRTHNNNGNQLGSDHRMHNINHNYGSYVNSNPSGNMNTEQFQHQRFGNDEFARRFAGMNASMNTGVTTSNYGQFQNSNNDNNVVSPFDDMWKIGNKTGSKCMKNK